jgi:hypothetical protein
MSAAKISSYLLYMFFCLGIYFIVMIFHKEFCMRNRTANFKIPVLALVPALVLLASCEFPQSARIKASPSLTIPIPLGNGENNSFIRSYVSKEGIQEQLKGDGGGKTPKVYYYNLPTAQNTQLNITGEDSVQTYLITYPLFDMSLDFDKYLNDTPLDTDEGEDTGKRRVPGIVISPETASLSGRLPPDGIPLPAIPVDLGDMKNLLSDITFKPSTSFSITIPPGKGEEMQKAIRIRIPQLKIGSEDNSSWVMGVIEDDKLVFKSSLTESDKDTALLLLSTGTTGTTEKKTASETITIHVKLVNKISADSYDTKLNFDWNTAKVTPNDTGKNKGKFEGLNLGSFLTDLGSGAQFTKIPAYLATTVPNTIAGFEVKIDNIETKTKTFVPDPNMIDERNEEELTATWFTDSTKYDFTDTLNGEKPLEYTITPPTSAQITNGTAIKNQKITTTLAILLPMSFEFLTSKTPREEQVIIGIENYLQIKFQGLDDFLGGGDDDKGGVMGEIGDVLGEGGLTNLILYLNTIANNATSTIYLGVNTDTATGEWKAAEIVKDKRDNFPLKATSLSNLPPVKFLVKEEKDRKGRLHIKRQDPDAEEGVDFKVKISVEADVNVDKSIDL